MSLPEVPTLPKPILFYALAYARAGISVFPVHGVVDGRCTCGKHACSDAGKHPVTRDGLKSATTDIETIQAWWAENPSYNVGCHAGRSGIYAIDDDTAKHGSDALERLAAEGKNLVSHVASRTGSGGRHLIFKATETDLDAPGVDVLRRAGYQGLDVRAGESYLILPPSRHASGGSYAWTTKVSSHTFRGALPELPAWWVEALRSQKADTRRAPSPIEGKVLEGGRHDAMIRIIGRLGRSLPLDELMVVAAALNDRLCEPPLPERELTDMVEYVADKEDVGSEDPRLEIHLGDSPRRQLNLLQEAIARVAVGDGEMPRLLLQNGAFVKVASRDDGGREVVRLDDSLLKRVSMSAARFVKDAKNDGLVEVHAPDGLVKLLKSAPTVESFRRTMPVLQETATLPFVAAGGGLVCRSCYSESERLLSLIPDGVGRRAAEAFAEASSVRASAAARRLREAFRDTPFADEGAWARCLAMLVTPAISRWLGDGEKWPWLVVDAPTQGTGKSTLARGLGALVGGAAVVRYKPSDDELEKAMHGLLERGVGAVVLDNLTGRVESDLLSILVTEREVTLRRLGSNQTPTFRNNLVLIGTANNPSISKDLATRALRVALDARTAKPDARQFEGDTPERAVKRDLAGHMGYVYDIVGWWARRGMPLSDERTSTRFRGWERAVREILGGAGVGSLDMRSEFAADPVEAAFASFVQAWWDAHADAAVGMNELRRIGFELGHLAPALGAQEAPRVMSSPEAANSKLGKMLQSRNGMRFEVNLQGAPIEVELRRIEGRYPSYRVMA